jgi:hypothetical protein
MTSLLEAAAEAGQPLGTLPSKKPNVLICTPCHSGKVDLNYHVSMMLAAADLSRYGVEFALDYKIGMSVDWARSQMATAFLKMPCTHLLFIDDDIAFAPDLPRRLLMENVDVVAVPYRRKQREVLYNIRHGVRVKTWPDRPYMVGVDSIATGMMLIRKNVFEKLAPTTPEFLYDNGGEKGKLFFRHQLVDDEMVGGVSYMGEDYWFCKTVREAGFDIWAYVDEEVGHIGQYAFDGAYSDHAAAGMKEKYTNDRPREKARIMLR